MLLKSGGVILPASSLLFFFVKVLNCKFENKQNMLWSLKKYKSDEKLNQLAHEQIKI